MKHFIHRILTHPLLLSLIVSVISITIFFPDINKYRVKLIDSNFVPEDATDHFHDLNNDGKSETIRFIHDDQAAIMIVYEDGKMLDQWNLQGRTYAGNNYAVFTDYDNNNLVEIFVFTFQNDSIVVNGYDPYGDKGKYFSEKFIANFSKLREGYDCQVYSGGFQDINQDGYMELIFFISSGFSKQPRNAFAYDIKNDTIIKSPRSGTAIMYPLAFDINDDGYDEYFGQTHAFNNCKEYPYPDSNAWLMVLNHRMEFLFKPIRIGHYISIAQTIPYKPSNVKYLAVLHSYLGTRNVKSSLMIFDCDGNLRKEREINQNLDLENAFLTSINKFDRDKLYMINKSGLVEELDSNLHVINSHMIGGLVRGRPVYYVDIDSDGEDEFIFSSENIREIILTQDDFSYPLKIRVPDQRAIKNISVINNMGQQPVLSIQCGTTSFLYHYFQNPMYVLKYLIFIGIYFTIFGLFTLFIIAQQRIKKRFETERKITELQLRTVKNQIDPHFTLNMLNAIGSLYAKNDTEKSNYLFGKFSALIRNTLINSDKINISLEEEIAQIRNYLDLEKFRYSDKFEYTININKEIQLNIQIPRMLLHTFVENAIKHGLRHLDKDGKLLIDIRGSDNQLKIIVEDNGVGRKKAAEYAISDTGKGLGIIDQIIELYKKLYGTQIQYQIVDLFDSDNSAQGTKVEILIPFKEEIL